jgi:hypothetical protein
MDGYFIDTVASCIIEGRKGRWSYLERKPSRLKLSMCEYREECIEVCNTGRYEWLTILLGHRYEGISMDDIRAILDEADRISKYLNMNYNLSEAGVRKAVKSRPLNDVEDWLVEKLSVDESDLNLLYSVRRLAALLYHMYGR